MKRRHLLGCSLALALVPGFAAHAQDNKAFTPQQLDQMLAPIALYPDPLLAQTLMASTYPLEVVQAACELAAAGADVQMRQINRSWQVFRQQQVGGQDGSQALPAF